MLLILILCLPIILIFILALKGDEWFGPGKNFHRHGCYPGYIPGENLKAETDFQKQEDYADFETMAAMGERQKFSDDLARDYNSYYAQVEDDAMMGDKDAIRELRGEFGEEGYLL
ncbi:MAG: hypothetical protein K5873_05035 [Treponema sp.]|nr:hypothetical protein [Treponema sp.]